MKASSSLYLSTLMKVPSINEEENSLLMTSATDDEIQVAQILVDFAGLIRARERIGPDIKWGCRKRRSGFDEEVEVEVEVELPYQKTDVGVQLTPRKPETAAVFSPITPLAFSPSESDDQRSNNTSKSKFKSRKVLVGMVQELSQCGDMLKGELVKVRDYRNKLLADNAKLKAAKEEAEREETLRLEKLMIENLAKNYEMGPAQLHNGLIRSSSHVKRETQQPLDAAGRSRCAEARRRRLDIMRYKACMRWRAAHSKYSRVG